MNNSNDNDKEINDSFLQGNDPKKEYSKPVLLVLGDLRTLTLGPSIGVVDVSGGGWPENTEFP
ncbi:MAG TPA: lasso RiPP family leader peptide-containing protein [Anaerolineales bacterium]|nr:lasso RiPP family leader peptide-containing protein [Anaerolineales bacterium]